MRKILFAIPVFLMATSFLQADVYVLQVHDVIDTISESYLTDNLKKLQLNSDCELIVLEIDTPGGFDSSMRKIIKEMLASSKPVVSFVYPRGARAASAGFFLMMASDIAVMNSESNCGAAHPVSVTGAMDEIMKEKVTNDAAAYISSLAKQRERNSELAEEAVRQSKSFGAQDALRSRLINFIAEDYRQLLEKITQIEYRDAAGNSRKVVLQGKNIIRLEMSPQQKFLKTITNPNIASFLLLFGLFGLYIEFTHPGAVIPGVVGAISLFLAFLAFQILPINFVGLGLILLAVGLLIAEVKVQGFGVLGIGGIISLILGLMMLIDAPFEQMRPTMSFIVSLAIMFAGLVLFLAYKVFNAQKTKVEAGAEQMIGEEGEARTEIGPSGGKVFVHGEWWNAWADELIPAGSKVEVIELENLKIKVRKKGG